jgi:hypothetical protein
MKFFLIAISFLFVGISFSQTKDEVDPRLIENQGTEIYNILKYRKDYYKFLLWELDNAYQVINTSDALGQNILPVSNIVDKNGVSFNPNEVNNPQTFNFIKYNFVRQKEQNVYYNLGNGKVLMFKALKSMWQEFDATGLNTKE